MKSPSVRSASAAAAIGIHVIAAAALLAQAPVRSVLLSAPPLMVELISAPRREAPPADVRPPQPTRVARLPELPLPPDVLVPSAPPTPPPSVAAPSAPAVPAAAPVASAQAITPAIYDADYLQNPPPDYPRLSRRMQEEGRVVLRVLVNTEGAAADIEIGRSSGHPRLDDAAREAVRRWKFIPARRGDDRIAAWVLVPISFRLKG